MDSEPDSSQGTNANINYNKLPMICQCAEKQIDEIDSQIVNNHALFTSWTLL